MTTPSKPCAICGKPMSCGLLTSRSSWRRQLYCSYECRRESRKVAYWRDRRFDLDGEAPVSLPEVSILRGVSDWDDRMKPVPMEG